MANKTEVSRILASKLVTVGSRYYDSPVLYYGESRYVTFPTYKRKTIRTNGKNKYTVINKSTEYRPDLISNQFYGTTIFWWQIMELNGIRDIWEFKSGLSILVPEIIL